MRQDTKGMNFENYAERIATLKERNDDRSKKQNCSKNAVGY